MLAVPFDTVREKHDIVRKKHDTERILQSFFFIIRKRKKTYQEVDGL